MNKKSIAKEIMADIKLTESLMVKGNKTVAKLMLSAIIIKLKKLLESF